MNDRWKSARIGATAVLLAGVAGLTGCEQDYAIALNSASHSQDATAGSQTGGPGAPSCVLATPNPANFFTYALAPAASASGQVCITAADWAGISGSGNQTPLDLIFVVDTTGSMGPSIGTLTHEMEQVITDVAKLAPVTRYGVVDFKDYPNEGGSGGDYPYQLDVPLTSTAATAQAAIARFTANGGGDDPESDWEALYQVATGVGGTGAFSYIPTSNPGWGSGTQKVVVLMTDAPFKDPGAIGRGITTAQVISALQAKGILVIGLALGQNLCTSNPDCDFNASYPTFKSIATATGAIAAQDTYFSGSGALEFHKGDPLVFPLNEDGSSPTGSSADDIAGAIIQGLTQILTFKVSLAVSGDTSNLSIQTGTPQAGLHDGDAACFPYAIQSELGAGAAACGQLANLTFSVATSQGNLLKRTAGQVQFTSGD